jgi:murein DD-endopeptidase MepM/ murein hydrolase activator NlpD
VTFTKKKNRFGKFIAIFLLLVLAGAGGFVYFSPKFEQVAPKIEINENIYWNLKSNIKIGLSDQSGIKKYSVVFSDGKNDVVLLNQVLDKPIKRLTLEVEPPKLDMFFKSNNAKLIIDVNDASKWNFLEGVRVVKTVDINIDQRKPVADVVSNSRYIRRGGSAVAVVKVEDENLDKAYITFNNKTEFKLTPYDKEGYFAALVAWPIDQKEFDGVYLVAIDKADNITKRKIPFYIQKLKKKADKINLSTKFIEEVSTHVLEQSNKEIPANLAKRFTYQNKDLRAQNIETIREIGLKSMSEKMVRSFNIDRFKRLRGSKTVAGYGELREYFYEGKLIDEAWHLGMDWASIKRATVRVSNSGKVVFNGNLGIYGNTVIIDHGLGLCSLYAHLSSSDVEIDEDVKPNQKIGRTGNTGAVFGDHLHFGVLIQGVEVNPIEWMDSNWIKTRITDELRSAKKEINSK